MGMADVAPTRWRRDHSGLGRLLGRAFAIGIGLLTLGAGTLFAPFAFAAGGTLVWARDGDSDSLDPQRTTTTLSWEVFAQIYDSLLAFDESGKPVPNLAKEWSVSNDGKEVVFKLNDGIKCHDGSAFGAEDVKFTIDRAMDVKNPSITKASWGPITSVDVVDPLTVSVKFSTPFAGFIPFMTDPMASMICRSNAQLGDKFGVSAAIGTGPWKFISWTKGDQIVLQRNEAYRNFGLPVANKGAPYLDKLVVKNITEGQSRLAGLKTGEIQVTEPPLEEVPTIKDDPKLQVLTAKDTGQNQFFEFTISRPPFNDVRARRAIAYAIDTNAALDIVFGGLVDRERCAVAHPVMGSDEEYCKGVGYEHDPAKAKALLAELGYGPDKPLEVIMMSSTGGDRDKILQVFQNQLAEVGVKAKIEMMDIGTLNARVTQENEKTTGPGTFDLMGWAWFDPDILYALWHTPGAYKGYHTPELDGLLEQSRTVTDPVVRSKIVHDIEKIILENAVMVPVYTPGWNWIYATRSDVKGFKVGPYKRPMFNDVKM
jgi:peptide/nickel transport system substrate-binding protein